VKTGCGAPVARAPARLYRPVTAAI